MSDEPRNPGPSTSEAGRTWADDELGRPPRPPPSTIDRYRVVDELGRGGMGTVYRVHDPHLDREVALKLLHAREGRAEHASEARSRLQREARAIAQVKHPNVIHVYDVGTVEHEGNPQVFVAMELVDGRSLRTWMKQLHATEGWSRGEAVPEIVHVLAQAGRGIAAAHRAGLVHRDFKPDNALLGDDGIVRVADFGLARRADTQDEEAPEPAELAPPQAPPQDPPQATPQAPPQADSDLSGSLDERLTLTGAAVGTPGYMAPEQFLGRAVDGRADQFAFCLTLHEALFDRRAFSQRGAALAMNVIQGRRSPMPTEPPVPAYLRALLDRGLHRDPEQRFESMDALVEALLDDPSERRRQRVRWALGVGVVATAVGVGMAARPTPADEDPCEHGLARVNGVWDGPRADAVDGALRADDLPYAAYVAKTTRRVLDDYAQGWADAHRDACEATHVRHEQTVERLDLRMACLDRRLAALQASVELLAVADRDQIEHAVGLVEGLPALEPCADPAALLADGPRPPDEAKAEDVARVHAELERARATQRLHRFEQALVAVDALRPRVDELEYPPLDAELLFERGVALVTADRFEEGEAVLRRSLMRAQALGMDAQVRDAATQISQVLGSHLARPEDALHWADLAEATDERIGSTPASQADLLRARAWVLVAWGQKPEAIDVVERARRTALEAHAPDDYEMIELYTGVGIVYAQLGELERAVPEFERAVILTETHLGPQHPQLIGVTRNLGNALAALRRPDEAERHLMRAADLVQELPNASGQQESLIASSLGNLAIERGDFERAYQQHGRALELREQLYGPSHPMVARSLNNVATAATRLGRIEEAVRLYRRAIEARETTMGPDHSSLITLRGNLGVLLAKQGRPHEALPLLDRVFAQMQEHGDAPSRMAELQGWLGQTLVETGEDRPRGMELVRRSLEELRELGKADDVERTEAWLRERGLEP